MKGMTNGQSRVGHFLRLGNDAIQPFEKSASNPLICNDRIFGAQERLLSSSYAPTEEHPNYH